MHDTTTHQKLLALRECQTACFLRTLSCSKIRDTFKPGCGQFMMQYPDQDNSNHCQNEPHWSTQAHFLRLLGVEFRQWAARTVVSQVRRFLSSSTIHRGSGKDRDVVNYYTRPTDPATEESAIGAKRRCDRLRQIVCAEFGRV